MFGLLYVDLNILGCNVFVHGHGHYMACCRLRYGHDIP